MVCGYRRLLLILVSNPGKGKEAALVTILAKVISKKILKDFYDIRMCFQAMLYYNKLPFSKSLITKTFIGIYTVAQAFLFLSHLLLSSLNTSPATLTKLFLCTNSSRNSNYI